MVRLAGAGVTAITGARPATRTAGSTRVTGLAGIRLAGIRLAGVRQGR
jgi:hypothetical protein